MSPTTSFHAWLKQRRKSLDLTQQELAERVGCAVETIRKIEAGTRRPSKEIAHRLADALTQSPEEHTAVVQLARGSLSSEGRHAVPETQPTMLLNHSTTNLPVHLAPLIGRVEEIATVGSLLKRADVRLLTLVGAPGIGKTRLSLQVTADLQDQFAHGVAFVELAPISDPKLVLSAIAQALGVKDLGHQELITSLKAYLYTKHLLLVLDNFEQVVEAAPVVAEFLQAAPHLKVLVTSRTPLHLYGEHEYAVPPLMLPDLQHLPPFQRVVEYEAMRLFEARAQAVNGDFALTPANVRTVIEICSHLDGLPLAIELAAARIKLFPPLTLLKRLSNRLQVLTGGARDVPARQQTLRSAIEWSYHLLARSEQRLFACLGVFIGGWTIEAAEAVCSIANDSEVAVDEGLQSLVHQSLVQCHAGPDGNMRFTMLETIREYAVEHLSASAEDQSIRCRHAFFLTDLAEAAELALKYPGERRTWLDRLEAEHDNLRGALQWLIEQREGELALRLASALAPFWDRQSHLSEGRWWLEQAVAIGGEASPAVLAKSLFWTGTLIRLTYRHKVDFEQAKILLEQSLALYHEIEDQRGIADVLRQLSAIAMQAGDQPQAIALCEQSLALWRTLGDTAGIARMLDALGTLVMIQGDYDRAHGLYAESLRLRRELGDLITHSLIGLGRVLLNRGAFHQARACFTESLALCRDTADKRDIATSLRCLGHVALEVGDYRHARTCFEESLALRRELQDKDGIAGLLCGLGYTALEERDPGQARDMLRESLVLFHELGDKLGIADCLEGLAGVSSLQGHGERAARLYSRAAMVRDVIGVPLTPWERLIYERLFAEARAHATPAAFSEALAEGQVMSLEQAVAYALENTGETLG